MNGLRNSMSGPSRSLSWYTPKQTNKNTTQSSEIFIDSRNPEYVNLALSNEPSQGKYEVHELSQNTNTETFVDSRKQEHTINNYDAPLLSSKQVKAVEEKPFNSDPYLGPNTAERGDFISSNSPFVHHNVLYEAVSNDLKLIVQQDEQELKRGNEVNTTGNTGYDYTDRLAQFKERESLNRSKNTSLEFQVSS